MTATNRHTPTRRPLPATSPIPLLALRYTGRFECIGAACEDHCCAHLLVTVDRPDYVRLKRTLGGTGEEREQFERGCLRTGAPADAGGSYAELRRTPEGACAFLRPDRLCSIHSAHGPAALPSVCGTYPRVVTRIGQRLSLTHAMSCPEAARLCLLAGDATRVEETDPRPVERCIVRYRLPARSRHPFVRNFLAIRGAFLELLGRHEYSMPGRLYTSAHLARRLDGVRATRLAVSKDARIGAAIEEYASAQRLAALDRECRAGQVSGALPFVLVQQVLIAAPRSAGTARFGALVDAVHGPFLDREEGAAGPTLRGGELWEAYLLRRRKWEEMFPERISQFVGNYASNYWMGNPFTASPDLLTHVLHLLARVAAIRFLLFNHPALLEVEDRTSTRTVREQALDRAVVDVVYSFTRAIEYADRASGLLGRALAQYRVRGIRAAAGLASF